LNEEIDFLALLTPIYGIALHEFAMDNDGIKEFLKRRLTKKEYKTLTLGLEDDALKRKLNADDERLEAIKNALVEKLKHPKIRNHIVVS